MSVAGFTSEHLSTCVQCGDSWPYGPFYHSGRDGVSRRQTSAGSCKWCIESEPGDGFGVLCSDSCIEVHGKPADEGGCALRRGPCWKCGGSLFPRGPLYGSECEDCREVHYFTGDIRVHRDSPDRSLELAIEEYTEKAHRLDKSARTSVLQCVENMRDELQIRKEGIS